MAGGFTGRPDPVQRKHPAMPPDPEIRIYTDGSALGNPGPGGWAAVVRAGRKTSELSGGFRRTTNNRMELYAAIAALESLKRISAVLLISDSRYLVESIAQGRVERWQSRRWMHTKNRPVPNADLWQRLLAQLQRHKIQVEWVEGHAGHPENERANRLAQQAALAADLPPDAAFEAAEEKQAAPDSPRQAGLFDLAPPPAPDPLPPPPGRAPARITRAGQPCRKCGAPVERRIPKAKPKPGLRYTYAWYFSCPNCGTNYLVDEARRPL